MIALPSLVLASLVLSQTPPPDASASPDRPNIIMILGDDQGFGDYGFMAWGFETEGGLIGLHWME